MRLHRRKDRPLRRKRRTNEHELKGLRCPTRASACAGGTLRRKGPITMGATAKHVVPESSNSSQLGFGTKKPVASVPAPSSRAQQPSSPSQGGPQPVRPLSLEVREAFVDAKGAGEFLQLNWRTVQKWAREGTIPAHPFGSGPRKTWRFLLSELHEWVRSLKNEACK